MNKISYYLNTFSIVLLNLFLFAFPLFFTILTTDTFALPKQLLLAGVSLVLLLVLAFRILSERTVRLRQTPLHKPILIFTAVVFLGSLLSPNRADSLTAFAGLFFAAVFYFLVVNFIRSQKEVFSLFASFLLGAFLTGVLFILNFFKFYILPFPFTKNPTFTPVGSLLDLAIYLLAGLSLLLYFIKTLKAAKVGKEERKSFRFLGLWLGLFLGTLLLALSLGLSVYSMAKAQNPLILPFDTGFQISFAAISQDTQRWILSFLLGSGFGTFASDFTRFKLAVFNNTPFWNLTFFRSSSFVLELLATTGILGLLSYLYLVFRVWKQKPMFFPLGLILLLSFVLPFSAASLILLFIVLSLYASLNSLNSKDYYDVELGLVTLRSGLLAVKEGDKREYKHGLTNILTLGVFLLSLILIGVLGFYTARYAFANADIQKSLGSQDSSAVYRLQARAINGASYVDAYRRLFSQTNLTIANSLLKQTKTASPSAQEQQTIYTLIQQSISNAREAGFISPNTAANFQNMSGIYRSLIGFGKDAEKFAETSQKQAILLDPTNPQEYINLGGLYYQLRDFAKAEEQFRLAINLKPNLANSHYNLAYTLKGMGRTDEALSEFEIVKELVKNQPDNLKKVESDISLLKQGLQPEKTPAGQPKTQLPPQYPPVAIPIPSSSPTPTPTPVH